MAYTADTARQPDVAEMIAGKYIPEIFSKNVVMHTKSNLVVADRVNVEYRKELRKGYKVHIPLMSEVTEDEVVPGSVGTAINIVGIPTSITVDQWRRAIVEEHDMQDIQDAVGYLEKAAQSCAYVIAKKGDTALGALFSTLGGSVYGSDTQDLTDDILLACMEYLDEGDVPEDDRCIIVNPSSKVDLLKIDKFVRNDYVREPVVPTGKFGQIYNMSVLITNNLTTGGTGDYAVMMHRDAIALVMQESPRSQRIPIPQEFRTIYQVDVLYGLGVLRATFGKAFYTRAAA